MKLSERYIENLKMRKTAVVQEESTTLNNIAANLTLPSAMVTLYVSKRARYLR